MNDETTSSTLSERAITIVGIAASLALSILLPVLADTGNTKLDVLLGTTGFIVGYLLTMDVATRAHLRQMEERLLDRIDEAEDRRFGALPLQRLLTVPDIEDAVRDVVSAAADARAKRMQFLANRTIERIKQDRDETLRIAQGIFRCADRREELRLIRFALADSRVSLKAVAALGIEHWRTPQFQEYYETYLEFGGAVPQTRIFLVTPEDMRDPVMSDILSAHASAGVTTYALDKTAIDPSLCGPLVLFDDELLLSHTHQQTGSGVDVHFTDDPLRVRDARESFDALIRVTKRKRGRALLWPSHPIALAEPVNQAEATPS